MDLTRRKSNFRALRKGDPKFTITDGAVTMGRAGFEINSCCPKSYQSVIKECIANGWLKPVAYVKEAELTWETLCE